MQVGKDLQDQSQEPFSFLIIMLLHIFSNLPDLLVCALVLLSISQPEVFDFLRIFFQVFFQVMKNQKPVIPSNFTPVLLPGLIILLKCRKIFLQSEANFKYFGMLVGVSANVLKLTGYVELAKACLGFEYQREGITILFFFATSGVEQKK